MSSSGNRAPARNEEPGESRERRLRHLWGTRLASRAWVGPVLASSLSLLTLGTLLYFLHQHDVGEHAADFDSDVEAALQSVRLHLRGDEEHIVLLASELAGEHLAERLFREQASRSLQDNAELDYILWADTDRIVRWVAPQGTHEQLVGRKLDLPDLVSGERPPWRTLSDVRMRVGHPEGGGPALEIYAPVHRNGDLLGVVLGVCPVERVLRHTVPPDVLENNRVTLRSSGGGSDLGSIGKDSAVDRRFARTIELAPFGHGLALRLERYSTRFFDIWVWLLVLLCVGLILGNGYSIWAVAREADERLKTQEVVERQRDNLVNVFEAMVDGVTIVSEQLDLQYVNPALVKDFGPYEGHKCYEYFHGQATPCSWCMMDDVIAGKTVHTEWCYPRNQRTYDLIDSRVSNADGSVSKLKIFRDITEREEAARALQESENRFHLLFERAAEILFLHDSEGRIVDLNQTACEALGYTRGELLSLRLADIRVDAGAQRGGRAARTLDLPGGDDAVSTTARYRRKDGSTFPVEVRRGAIDYPGQQLFLASARDITEREAAERAVKRQLEAEKAAAEQTRLHLEESKSLHRVTSALLEKTTLAEVLEVVCRESQRLTRATGSAVLHLQDGHFELGSWSGELPPVGERMPAGGSFAGLAVERGEPVFVADLTLSGLRCYREPRPESLIVCPLRVAGEVIGALEVAGGADTFGRGDIRILTHLADQAAIAIVKARLRDQAEQVAVLQERHRLSRELHDSVSQYLFSAALYAEAASQELTCGHQGRLPKHLEGVMSQLREAMLEMRILIFELHPPLLQREGLLGAIETRLAAVEARAGIDSEISVSGVESSLPAEIEEALYGVAQEALNNALKHSDAKKIQVRAHFQPTVVTLEVVDDGRGFDLDRASGSGGMGLRSMRERLEHLSGTLEIESAPRRGATVRAEVAIGAGEASNGREP